MEMLNVCHLAGISARLGRTVKWDNANELIVDDEEASSFLARPYRQGYEIELAANASSGQLFRDLTLKVSSG